MSTVSYREAEKTQLGEWRSEAVKGRKPIK